MPLGNFHTALAAHLRQLPSRQRWLLGGVSLLLILLLAFWLYLYFKPYYRLKGYRLATPRSLNEFLQQGSNRQQFDQLTRYLHSAGVGEVTATENLLRQGSDWLDINEPPYAMPPRAQWPNIIATLELVRDQLQPAIGPVDIVSAFRTDRYNRNSGGSSGSKHKNFCGIDLVPRSNIRRRELVKKLRSLQAHLGPSSRLGLGIYHGLRFHIDTCGFRRW